MSSFPFPAQVDLQSGCKSNMLCEYVKRKEVISISSIVRMDKVCKQYSGLRDSDYASFTVNNLTFNVEEGEFVAITGPSGSGKSTLLNLLGCLDKADSGTYELEGVPVERLSDNALADIRNRKIGFVFQSYNLLPRLTAFENVELPLIYRGIPRKQRRNAASEALDAVGLMRDRLKRPSELSGGMQQRVAIARAIAGEPKLVLADEPTGALDSRTGEDVMHIFKRLHHEGKTIMLITHDQTVAGWAERSLRIRDGRIIH